MVLRRFSNTFMLNCVVEIPRLGTNYVESISRKAVSFYLFVAVSVLFEQHGGNTVTKKVLLGRHNVARGRIG